MANGEPRTTTETSLNWRWSSSGLTEQNRGAIVAAEDLWPLTFPTHSIIIGFIHLRNHPSFRPILFSICHCAVLLHHNSLMPLNVHNRIMNGGVKYGSCS